MRGTICRTSLAALAILCAPMVGHASGHLPIPPTTQQFKSHEDCAAALQRLQDADQKQVAPKTTKADGATREVDLDTKGIERLGPKDVRYEATLWFHHGHLIAEPKGTETSHSFQRRLNECQDDTLHTSGEDGFTLSTFDP